MTTFHPLCYGNSWLILGSTPAAPHGCPLPRAAGCFPGIQRVPSRLSYSSPHVAHFIPTPLILSDFCYSGRSRGILILLCADDFFQPCATARFPRQPPTIPIEAALNHLFPSFFFPPNIFWFNQTVHHDYSSEPSLFETLAVGLSVRFCAPLAGSFPAFSRHFQDVHVSSTQGY